MTSSWQRRFSLALSALFLLSIFPSALMSQEEAKRPRKFDSEVANDLLRDFNAAERDLRKAKDERDKQSAKDFTESHNKLREEFLAELKESLVAETKQGNLDNALEIRSAIRFFKKLRPDAADLKTLTLENERLRKKVSELEKGPSQSTQTSTKKDQADPSSKPSELTDSVGMKLRLIPAGKFMMGVSQDKLVAMFKGVQTGHYTDEMPKHRVRISKPFYMGVHEVTVGQFRQFVDETKYVTNAERDASGGWGYDGKGAFIAGKKFSWRSTGFDQEDDQPVVNVTWFDAVEFCKWLSEKEGVEYQLPTEAQWEYSCRAGMDRMFSGDESPNVLMSIANIADATLHPKLTKGVHNKLSDGCAFTNVVGQYQANRFGLHDMVGNVSEWCLDWHDKDYYKRSPSRDPNGADRGQGRVLRGSGFQGSTWQSRSADRSSFAPNHRAIDLGFRVIRVSDSN